MTPHERIRRIASALGWTPTANTRIYKSEDSWYLESCVEASGMPLPMTHNTFESFDAIAKVEEHLGRNKVMPKATAALAVVIRDGKMLLLQRGMTAPLQPGDWAIPGGSIEPGETPAEAALRELKEETGLDGKLPVYLLTTFTQGGQKVEVYRVYATEDDVKLSSEHDDSGWFTGVTAPGRLGPISARLLVMLQLDEIACVEE